MKFVIDRFEEQYAVCENEHRSMVNIERTKISKKAKEGDVLIYVGGIYIIDEEETKLAKKKIEELLSDMFEV